MPRLWLVKLWNLKSVLPVVQAVKLSVQLLNGLHFLVSNSINNDFYKTNCSLK